ncbi:MAG: GspH/FimT family pseudopilin [Anaerohalosphaeraceae bacterium]
MKTKWLQHHKKDGFTLVELLIVVVILSVAAMIVVPTLSSAADMQVRSAANTIAADLDYARGLAVTRQTNYSVVFNPDTESYEIRRTSDNTVIANPLMGGQNYVVAFDDDSRLSQVDIASANFDSDTDNAVTFNYLGAPFKGIGTGTSLTSGRVTLQAGTFTLYVDVEPVTGYVTINQP